MIHQKTECHVTKRDIKGSYILRREITYKRSFDGQYNDNGGDIDWTNKDNKDIVSGEDVPFQFGM